MEDQRVDTEAVTLWPVSSNKTFPTVTMKINDEKPPEATSPESPPYLAALSHTSTDGDDSPDDKHNTTDTSDNNYIDCSNSPNIERATPRLQTSASEDYDVEDTTSWTTAMDAATSWSTLDNNGMAMLPAILDEDDCSSGILHSDMFVKENESVHSFASMETVKTPIGRLSQADSITTVDPLKAKPVLTPEEAEDTQIDQTCHGALNINPKQLAGVFALFKSETKMPEHSRQAQYPADPPGIATIELAGITPSAVQPSTEMMDFPLKRKGRPLSGYASNRKLTAELYWKPRAKTLEQECSTLKDIVAADSKKVLQLKTALALQSAAIASFKEKLKLSSQKIESLQKEKDVLIENEIDFRETIRILKHEVDILTRNDEEAQEEGIATKHDAFVEEEVQQLRMENQLFAAQIIEYETELENIVQVANAKSLGTVESNRVLKKHDTDTAASVSEVRNELFRDDILDEAFLELEQASEDEQEAAGQSSEDRYPDGTPFEAPPQLVPQQLLGAFLGLFTLVGDSGNEEKTSGKSEVFVIQERIQRTNQEAQVDTIEYRTPEEEPFSVEVERLSVPDQIESRESQVADTGQRQQDIVQENIVQEDIDIEVLQNQDATMDIEVQLSHYPSGHGQEHETRYTCDEDCGAWNIFCLFGSEPQDQN